MTINELGKTLFLSPTKDWFIQIFRYLFVGGLCFALDAGTLMLLCNAGLHYLIAVVIAFVVGLISNYALSKAFVFQAYTCKKNCAHEFIQYAFIGVVGLCITELLLYLNTDILQLPILLGKCVATAVVMLWNFFMRRLLYTREEKSA